MKKSVGNQADQSRQNTSESKARRAYRKPVIERSLPVIQDALATVGEGGD